MDVIIPHQRLAIFVDGENLAVRLENVEKVVGKRYRRHPGFVEPAVAYWSEAVAEAIGRQFQLTHAIHRIYYYTTCRGDEAKLETLRERLQDLGIGSPWVLKKTKSKDSKAVDIRLATDLLGVAASRQVDDVVLVAMDVDYLPVVEKAKEQGVRMFLAFPGFELRSQLWIADHDAITKAMGVSSSKAYTLAFDRVLRDVSWFGFVPLDAGELAVFARQHVLPIMAKVTRIDFSQVVEPHDGFVQIRGDDDWNIQLRDDGFVHMNRSRKGTQLGPLYMQPEADFATRFETSFRQFLAGR